MGVTLDPSGAVLGNVSISLTNEDGTQARSAVSDENGRFGFLLLPSGTYELQANKFDFKRLSLSNFRLP